MTAVTEDKVPVGLRELTIRDRATKSRAETIAFIGNTDDNVTVSPIAERMGAAVQPCIMARAECSCVHPVSFGTGYIFRECTCPHLSLGCYAFAELVRIVARYRLRERSL